MTTFRRTQPSRNACSLAASIARGVCLGLIAISLNPHQVIAAGNPAQAGYSDRSSSPYQLAGTRPAARTTPAVAPHPRLANFEGEHKSEDARQLADWVMDSGDNRRMPFAIVDKTDAKVFVFDAGGRLRGAAPALLGLARGDYSVTGIGNRKMSDIRPEERTTPAGRFVASLGRNYSGKDVLWVDYKNAISLHRVITTNPEEHRLERMASQKPREHRISYGCINVPAKFFDNVVKPAFTGTRCVVYVLPETRSLGETFRSYYDVESRWGRGTGANPGEGTRPWVRRQEPGFERRTARPYGPPDRTTEEYRSRMTSDY